MADYNEIYDKLVESEVDFIGLIAYGLYKRGKRRHIISFIEQNGRRPSKKEIASYVNVALGQLDIYKSQANQVFGKVVAEEVRKELERTREHQKLVEIVVKEAKEELGKVKTNYQEAVESAVKAHTFSFWETVGVNVFSSFVFPLVVLLLIVVICLFYPNLLNHVKELINNI